MRSPFLQPNGVCAFYDDGVFLRIDVFCACAYGSTASGSTTAPSSTTASSS
eukprot:CAMPEP_0183372062 /NCGR_PEP_ID=MMETSP0164_2-20130417/107413_1 /TAXON_ID=221442 /ORGANISM="Coccolithus pelagicus ssp braarudi, Strain PLY182g" /LENGTH=50 /DNA_ID=CAMNT_0025548721 /DNA_START=54 /DNA_END=204 /DNA_ORIENTATION=-